MGEDAFKTIHDINYKKNTYLYHYSSFEKATKIIHCDSLRFSNIFSLNDTTEYKPKIKFAKDDPINKDILARCKEINRFIKICCFSQDNTEIKRFTKKNDFYFTDYSGRGFALPRMWAQYGADNKGVCFIINKSNLEEAICNRLKILGSKPIQYIDRYSCFCFTSRVVSNFKNQVLSRGSDNSIAAEKFMETYPKYIDENYFTKLSDWRDEHEYRIALFSSSGENLTIDNFSNFIEGIIIGENVDAVDAAIIRKLLKKKVPIKRIVFQHQCITLTG